MSKYRIQYKDKPVTLGGLIISPYTFFINEQDIMTAYAETRNVHTDKAGHGYIRLKLLLSDQGRGYWYPALLYNNGRVAYIDRDKKFVRLRGLYPRVFDAFLSKFSTTEIKVAEKRHDVDDDARIFGDLPVMRQPQRASGIVRYKDTRYQIHKLSSGSDSSKDFDENRSTNSCVYWYTLNEYGRGKSDATVSRTKKQDYTEKKPVYAGKISRDDEKKKTHFAPDLEKYLDQFNDNEYAEVIFRDAMTALRDNFA